MSYLQARENNYELKHVLYTGYDFTLYRRFIQEGYKVEWLLIQRQEKNV